MASAPMPISSWGGQLPPHIAGNEKVWWEVFPRIRPRLPSKLAQLFGGAKQSPSRETIGKVVLVAHTKSNLRSLSGTTGASLLNHWDCYCLNRLDGLEMSYMAGTATDPSLIFDFSPLSLTAMVILKFAAKIDPSLADDVKRIEQSQIESLKELGREMNLEESEVSVWKFKHGSWENGLDITFKAALWLNSNREEALAHIWKIQV